MGERVAGCKPVPSAPLTGSHYAARQAWNSGTLLPSFPDGEDTGVPLHAWFSLLPGMLEGQEAEDCDCSVFQAQGAPDRVGLSCVGLVGIRFALGDLFEKHR